MIINRVNTEYMQRCDRCGRVGSMMYYFNLKGVTHKVCSMIHAREIEDESKKQDNPDETIN